MARKSKDTIINELQTKLTNTEKWLKQAEERNIKLVKDAESEFLNSPTYHQMKERIVFYENLYELSNINTEKLNIILQRTRSNSRQIFEDNKRLVQNQGTEYAIGITEPKELPAGVQQLRDEVNELQGKLHEKEMELKALSLELERWIDLVAVTKKENEQLRHTDNKSEELLNQLDNWKTENEQLKKTLKSSKYEVSLYEILLDTTLPPNDKEKESGKKKGAPIKIQENTRGIIVEMRRKGCSIRTISKTTGVSVGMVHQIVKQSEKS